MIPLRFKAICEGCGEEVDVRRPGVAQHVTGWAVNRSGGGPNQIALRETDPRWLCHPCLELRRGGHNPAQEALL